MAKRAKEPGRRLLPEVRGEIDLLFARGWTPGQVYRRLKDLAQGTPSAQRLREQAGLGHLHPGDLQVTYRTIAERHRRWRETRGNLPPGLSSWVEFPAEDAGLVLRALAAYEAVTGEWRQPTREEAKRMVQLARLAPSLPPQACASLAFQMSVWEYLPEERRRQLEEALGRFLGHQPWTSPEAAERYAQSVSGRTHLKLNEAGMPVHVTVVVDSVTLTEQVGIPTIRLGRPTRTRRRSATRSSGPTEAAEQ